MANWHVYTGVPGARTAWKVPPPPPWRTFNGEPLLDPPDEVPDDDTAETHQASSYRPDADTIEQVNAALFLRRPLLVTGRPGTGKSTLAYAVARELGLGPVLYWPITSRATVQKGLYSYDPLTRLFQERRRTDGMVEEDIGRVGRYIRLGPLGTALLPYKRPRVLLIDEVDKGDIDFPNDLLTIFEKGAYNIFELQLAGEDRAEVATADGLRAPVEGGRVRCNAFPFVVMTSNGDREFPDAFLRRCITANLAEPGEKKLRAIVAANLKNLAAESNDLIELFLNRRSEGQLATDQLLHAVYLLHHADLREPSSRAALAKRVMPFLGGDPSAELMSDDS